MRERLHKFLFYNHTPSQTVIKNTIWLILSDFFSKGSTVVMMAYIAFVLGPTQFGIYNLISSFIGVLMLLVDFGLITTSIRQARQHPETKPETLLHSYQLKIILSVLGLIIISVYQLGRGNPGGGALIWFVYFFAAVINNFSEYLRAMHRIDQHMQDEARIKIINGVCVVCIATIVLFVAPSLLGFFIGMLIASIVQFCVARRYTRSLFPQAFSRAKRSILLTLAKKSYPLAFSTFMIALYTNADQIILGEYGQYEALGIYSFAYSIIFVYTSLSSAFFNALFPLTTTTITLANHKKVYLYGLGRIALYTFPAIALCVLTTYLLIISGVTFLGAYTQSLRVLLILWLYCLLEPFGSRGYTNLLSLRKDKISMLFLGITIMLNIAANLLLIPKFSYRVAARAAVGSYLLYTGLCFWYLTSYLPTSTKKREKP